MKKLIYLIFASCIIFSCNSGNKQEDTESESDSLANTVLTSTDGVFIHMTESYKDPHRVLMPLKMANIMAEDKAVLVYMDIDAVRLLVKGAKDIQMADFESAQTYLQKLLDKKVEIYACPTCLKMAGFKESDLIAGVQIAKKDRFFDFTKGRIINLDY